MFKNTLYPFEDTNETIHFLLKIEFRNEIELLALNRSEVSHAT